MNLSIDIGIRNLSLCCMSLVETDDLYNIHLWDVYNTLDTEDYYCDSLKKNGEKCGKTCNFKYKKENGYIFTCKTHFPKNITIKNENHYKKKLIDSYLLQDIATIVLQKLQSIYNENKELFTSITSIIIELQPKINQKMKFISHIVYGKLVELYYNTNTTIRFVRASQKLKAYNGPQLECKLKGAYTKRKWLSVQYTNWFLENKVSNKEKWVCHFNNHKKKDDMGDTFLMGINATASKKTDKRGKCIK